MKISTSKLFLAAFVSATFAGSASAAALTGELGILDVSGINPNTGVQWAEGDTYHLMFVSSTTVRDASSTTMQDYHDAITTFANNAGLAGDWFVFGSTTPGATYAQAAIDIGVTNDVNAAVLRMDSVQIAPNFGDLLDNSTNILNPISVDENGNTIGDVKPATGLLPRATGIDRHLGNSVVRHGRNLDTTGGNGERFYDENDTTPGTQQHFYGITDVLTVSVVPEPSSLALLALGGACVLRRRRS